MTTDNFCFYLENRLIQTSQTGGQWYSDSSPFSIPWIGLHNPSAGTSLANDKVLVHIKPLRPSLIFACNHEPLPLGWKGLPGTNTLAYFAFPSMTVRWNKLECFITFTPCLYVKWYFFVPCNSFQPSLIFSSEAEAYSIGEHLWPVLKNFLRPYIMTFHNKLEHLSLASLSNLV